MNCITKKIQFIFRRSIHLDNQIIYNSFLEKQTRILKQKEKFLIRKRKKNDNLPCLVKFYQPSDTESTYNKSESLNPKEQLLVQSIKFTNPNKQTSASNIPSNWMSDYESYPETITDDLLEKPIQTMSQIPCGGCGSNLQCQNSSLPGYLPKEIFNNSSNLNKEICKRCHFLKHYDTALNVTIDSDDYPKILSHVKDKRALIILMVDLLDYPCSFWPDIEKIIGEKRPVILVGNKIDLLPRDSPDFLQRISKTLLSSLNDYGLNKLNVKHVSLISAKTGFGVEELINALHKLWKTRGDVYLMGCTNVGKSTLFNALLQSDYCKVQAIDLIQRATTSLWPGTTLNLLKFPILRPSPVRLYERVQRLIQLEKKRGFISDIKNEGSPLYEVGKTFISPDKINTNLDPFSHEMKFRYSEPGFGLDPKEYQLSKWCYDTPGAIHPDQLNHFLTIEELIRTLPQSRLIPKSYRIIPGWTLFIAGLARLDLITSDNPVIMTVLASEHLPVTICETKNANELYKELLGSSILGVPLGSEDRLSSWPKLASQTYSVTGIGLKKSAADVVFSTAGWISITLKDQEIAQLEAWTPAGKGLYKRDQSLLPNSVHFKGPLIRKTPLYSIKYK